MWNRRASYKNKWTNQREAMLGVIGVSIFFTVVLYYFAWRIDGSIFLWTWAVLGTMAMPALVGGGFWLGTMEKRGYQNGVNEKAVRATQPIVIQPSEYLPQIAGPSITHQETVDVSTA